MFFRLLLVKCMFVSLWHVECVFLDFLFDFLLSAFLGAKESSADLFLGFVDITTMFVLVFVLVFEFCPKGGKDPFYT